MVTRASHPPAETLEIEARRVQESDLEQETAPTVEESRRERRSPVGRSSGSEQLFIAIGCLLLLLTLLSIALDDLQVHSWPLQIHMGLELSVAVAEAFSALVLFLFPPARAQNRLRWMAGALVVLASGSFVFGYLQPLMSSTATSNVSAYSWLLMRLAAGLLLAQGLVRTGTPEFAWHRLGAALLLFSALEVVLASVASHLPAVFAGPILWPDLYRATTPTYQVSVLFAFMSLIPLALIVAATVSALRYARAGTLGIWLPISMLFLLAADLNGVFWPYPYSPVLTATDLIRLAFGVVVAVGTTLELRAIILLRTTRLTTAQELADRLAELNVIKANFTAMVAHELGGPVSAIRMSTEMLATGELDAEQHEQTLDVIRQETDLLSSLVSDVRAAAMVEREEFAIEPRPVSLLDILSSAISYAKTLPGDHPLVVPLVTQEVVWADPERIGQVLRNLLSNAVKYSPEGSPVQLCTRREGQWVRVEVIDSGFGIHPEDLVRVFDKFGRGRNAEGTRIRGVGLGLYLSRRIVRAHGSDLTVQSNLNHGSTFGFRLEVVL